MYRLSLLSMLLITSAFCAAQKSSFGIVDYTTKPGYELIKNDKVLTLYKEDKSTGAYCNIFIYQFETGKGGVQQDFDFAWVNYLQKPFKVTGDANKQPSGVVKGWQLMLGTTNYPDNGVATLAMLITLSGEGKMQNICILSNSDKYKTDIEDFIASVDVSKEINTTGSSQAATDNSIKTNPAITKKEETPASPVKNIKYEVWECQVTDIFTLKPELKTVILSPDGKCLFYMPEKGLNGVTCLLYTSPSPRD